MTTSLPTPSATFVLVHGTTGGGWVWQRVAHVLRQAGHAVYTPTLTGLGERVHLLTRQTGLETHIADIVNVLVYEDLRDVILVGHSYGGVVVLGVAERVPERIRLLVNLDGGVLHEGESALDTMGPETRASFEAQVRDQGGGWLIPVQRGPNDVPAKNTPHPWKAWTDPITRANPAAARLPRAYVRFTRDKQPGQVWYAAMQTSWERAQAEGWRTLEVDTVHQILPDPEPKAAVLLELARGV